MNSLKKSMEDFNRVYNRTARAITFDKHWKSGLQSVGGAVDHIDFRVILPHGEIVKTTDDHGRRVLLIGTMYGLIAINETFFRTSSGIADPQQPLHYSMTPALAGIWESYYHIHVPTSDYLHASGVPPMLSDKFLLDVAEIAAQEIGFGRKPGDGMKIHIVAKPKQPDHNKNKGRRDDAPKGRSAKKNDAFKAKQKEAAAKPAPEQAKPQEAKPQRKRSRPPRSQRNVELKNETAKAIAEVIPQHLQTIHEEMVGSVIQQDLAKRHAARPTA